jgi:hypothetical protein
MQAERLGRMSTGSGWQLALAHLQDVLQGVVILAKEVHVPLGVVGAHTQRVDVRACR